MASWVRQRSRGYTIFELMVVLGVLAIVARLALPATDPARPFQADAAVHELTQALRFARSEAVRTGSYRFLKCDLANNRFNVYALNMAVNPPAEDTANPVMNPLDQRNYVSTFSSSGTGAALTLDTCTFTYSDGKTVSQIGFASDGAPVNVVGPNSGDVKTLNGVGEIRFALGPTRRSVFVDSVTGRITAGS